MITSTKMFFNNPNYCTDWGEELYVFTFLYIIICFLNALFLILYIEVAQKVMPQNFFSPSNRARKLLFQVLHIWTSLILCTNSERFPPHDTSAAAVQNGVYQW